MTPIDPETHNFLRQLEFDLNIQMDRLIVKRQTVGPVDRSVYRYVTNKIQSMLTNVNKALDKVEEEQ